MKIRDFDEQNNHLHCYKLIESGQTLTLKHYLIKRWNHISLGCNSCYQCRGKYIDSTYKIDSVKDSKIDRLVNNKFYTFNSDVSFVEQAITEHLVGQVVDATTKLNSSKLKLEIHSLYQPI